jgi:hypothetical protein
MLVKVYFFGKGPGQGRIPGLLGHGPQIPDRTIDHCKATDQCSKFQLQNKSNGREFESPSVHKTILQIKCYKIVESKLESAKSIVSDIKR